MNNPVQFYATDRSPLITSMRGLDALDQTLFTKAFVGDEFVRIVSGGIIDPAAVSHPVEFLYICKLVFTGFHRAFEMPFGFIAQHLYSDEPVQKDFSVTNMYRIDSSDAHVECQPGVADVTNSFIDVTRTLTFETPLKGSFLVDKQLRHEMAVAMKAFAEELKTNYQERGALGLDRLNDIDNPKLRILRHRLKNFYANINMHILFCANGQVRGENSRMLGRLIHISPAVYSLVRNPVLRQGSVTRAEMAIRLNSTVADLVFGLNKPIPPNYLMDPMTGSRQVECLLKVLNLFALHTDNHGALPEMAGYLDGPAAPFKIPTMVVVCPKRLIDLLMVLKVVNAVICDLVQFVAELTLSEKDMTPMVTMAPQNNVTIVGGMYARDHTGKGQVVKTRVTSKDKTVYYTRLKDENIIFCACDDGSFKRTMSTEAALTNMATYDSLVPTGVNMSVHGDAPVGPTRQITSFNNEHGVNYSLCCDMMAKTLYRFFMESDFMHYHLTEGGGSRRDPGNGYGDNDIGGGGGLGGLGGGGDDGGHGSMGDTDAGSGGGGAGSSSSSSRGKGFLLDELCGVFYRSRRAAYVRQSADDEAFADWDRLKINGEHMTQQEIDNSDRFYAGRVRTHHGDLVIRLPPHQPGIPPTEWEQAVLDSIKMYNTKRNSAVRQHYAQRRNNFGVSAMPESEEERSARSARDDARAEVRDVSNAALNRMEKYLYRNVYMTDNVYYDDRVHINNIISVYLNLNNPVLHGLCKAVKAHEEQMRRWADAPEELDIRMEDMRHRMQQQYQVPGGQAPPLVNPPPLHQQQPGQNPQGQGLGAPLPPQPQGQQQQQQPHLLPPQHQPPFVAPPLQPIPNQYQQASVSRNKVFTVDDPIHDWAPDDLFFHPHPLCVENELASAAALVRMRRFHVDAVVSAAQEYLRKRNSSTGVTKFHLTAIHRALYHMENQEAVRYLKYVNMGFGVLWLLPQYVMADGMLVARANAASFIRGRPHMYRDLNKQDETNAEKYATESYSGIGRLSLGTHPALFWHNAAYVEAQAVATDRMAPISDTRALGQACLWNQSMLNAHKDPTLLTTEDSNVWWPVLCPPTMPRSFFESANSPVGRLITAYRSPEEFECSFLDRRRKDIKYTNTFSVNPVFSIPTENFNTHILYPPQLSINHSGHPLYKYLNFNNIAAMCVNNMLDNATRAADQITDMSRDDSALAETEVTYANVSHLMGAALPKMCWSTSDLMMGAMAREDFKNADGYRSNNVLTNGDTAFFITGTNAQERFEKTGISHQQFHP